jgi:hypothetical protein
MRAKPSKRALGVNRGLFPDGSANTGRLGRTLLSAAARGLTLSDPLRRTPSLFYVVTDNIEMEAWDVHRRTSAQLQSLLHP